MCAAPTVCSDMMRTRTLLTMYMKMDSDNYPEILFRMCIINAPGWFSNMWSSIKSFMSGDTPKKIEVGPNRTGRAVKPART
jgi:CRAL/TRIO domain